MRKIKSNFFISLDGVVESPDKWHFPYFNDEMERRSAPAATADALLMGRVLYDEWAAYWPEHADEPFGDVMNSIKKYVVSDSLEAAEWQNSELISGNVATQKLTDIKAQEGGDIAMSGSPTTVRWLLREGYSTSSTCSCTRSLSAAAWLASFAGRAEHALELMSAQTFKTGVLNLSYAPANG